MEIDNKMLHTTGNDETVSNANDFKSEQGTFSTSPELKLSTSGNSDKIPLLDDKDENNFGVKPESDNGDEKNSLLIDTIAKLEKENKELQGNLDDTQKEVYELLSQLQSQPETEIEDTDTVEETPQLTTIYDDYGNVDIASYRLALDIAMRFKRGNLAIKTDIAYQYKNIFDELLNASNTVFSELASEMNEYVFPDVTLPKITKGNDYQVANLEEIDTKDRSMDN